MASNSLPKSRQKLMTMANLALLGAAAHGAEVGILQNSEAKVRTDLDRLRDLSSSFEAAQAAKVAATELQSGVDHSVRQFLSDARHLLGRTFGSAWSSQWLGAGFRNESTAIPRTMSGRLELLHSLARCPWIARRTARARCNATAPRDSVSGNCTSLLFQVSNLD